MVARLCQKVFRLSVLGGEGLGLVQASAFQQPGFVARRAGRRGAPRSRGIDRVVAGSAFTVDQIGASLTPMMLPANRVMGDDGVYVA